MSVVFYLDLKKTKRFSCYDVVQNLDYFDTVVLVQQVESYTEQIITSALNRRPNIYVTKNPNEVARVKDAVQFCDFELINWDDVLDNDLHQRASSYVVRKGLSRKAQFSSQLRKYCAKHPQSILKRAIPKTCVLETWDAFSNSLRMNFGTGGFANFDDDFTSTYLNQMTLREKLNMVLEENSEVPELMLNSNDTWILKPSVVNKGLEISIINSYNQLLDTLENVPDIREWVLQKYLTKPLLCDQKKFHLRVYVMCVGALQVYVFDKILMLVAAHTYHGTDASDPSVNLTDIYQHLTNTARMVEDDTFIEEDNVKLLEDLVEVLLRDYKSDQPGGFVDSLEQAASMVENIKSQICEITGEVFGAFENEYTIFCPMEHCFELYGLDFMVEVPVNQGEDMTVSILEINPGPDFKQTGDRLKLVIEELIEETCKITIDNYQKEPVASDVLLDPSRGQFIKVYDKEWSVSKLRGGMSMK